MKDLKIQSRVEPDHQPSLDEWLKQFVKPILSSTDTSIPLYAGSIKN